MLSKSSSIGQFVGSAAEHLECGGTARRAMDGSFHGMPWRVNCRACGSSISAGVEIWFGFERINDDRQAPIPPQPAHGSGTAGAPARSSARCLMTDSGAQRSGRHTVFSGLTEAEIAQVLGSGKRQVLYRSAQLFSQGSPQDGIFLIESGRIKVFYTAPSGPRDHAFAYWHSGNFVGGPEVFKQGLHVWSGEGSRQQHGAAFAG